MRIFLTPAVLLFLLAGLILTVCGRKWPALSYAGGLCWAAGIVGALVEGATLGEIALVTMFFLAVSGCRLRRAGKK